VHTRHESGAGYVAECWARSSGEPGVSLVTAGPGLTSALTPLASARMAEVSVILLSASHPRCQDGRGAFQELDQVQLTRQLCRASIRCPDGGQAAAVLDWAWQRAAEFPPGPVHVELPADVLTEAAPTTCHCPGHRPRGPGRGRRVLPERPDPAGRQLGQLTRGRGGGGGGAGGRPPPPPPTGQERALAASAATSFAPFTVPRPLDRS
jgi:thiamine pyrophosphate-dependent acetolactate synthase large subunit-like protein